MTIDVRWMLSGVLVVVFGCADDGISTDPVDTAAPLATGDDDDGGGGDPSYADVAPILDAHCTSCHGTPTSGGAPFALDSYDAAASKAGRIVARAVDGDPSPMPPGALALSDADAARLVAWEEAGAPL